MFTLHLGSPVDYRVAVCLFRCSIRFQVTSLSMHGYWKVSEDIANGMTVSADISFAGDTGDDGGSSLTITGELGNVDLGETSGTTE